MNIEEVKQKITPVLDRYDIRRASVFGSVARGEARPDSDVDLVVSLGKLPFGIWGLVALKQDLEQALKKKVDVISDAAMNPMLRNKIQKDITEIYVQRA